MRISFIFLILLLNLTGCAAVLIGTGGTMIAQEKSIGDSISDNTIWARIKAAFASQKIDHLWGDITVSVSEGRVLLTGHTKTADDMVKILKTVWQQNGVRDVINEIKISNENTGSIGSYTNDLWITTQIKSRMLVSKKIHIRTINYSVETIESVVYLFGIAQTREEIQAVEDIAYSVSGVKDVKSYMRIKEDDVRSKLKKLASDKAPQREEKHNHEGVHAEDLESVFNTGKDK